MNATQWLTLLGLGVLLGAVGQMARVIVGLKKHADATAAQGVAFRDSFDSARLMISIMIGAVAGALAAISLLDPIGDKPVGRDALLALITAGYAGSDFIEGFIQSRRGYSAHETPPFRLHGSPAFRPM